MKDTYKETQVIKTDRAEVKVLRPILTEQERQKRMAEIENASANLLRKKGLNR